MGCLLSLARHRRRRRRHPRVAESYRKRMDLGVDVRPSTCFLASSYISSANASSLGSSPSAYNLFAPLTSSLSSKDARAFRSLMDQVGCIESLGLGQTGVMLDSGGVKEDGLKGKLKFDLTEFDLTENAWVRRLAKREIFPWDDLSSAGFTRSDTPLSATSQFHRR
ncbi:hypothetical protein B0H15DRAFT_135799 [Mycena belliarum]|uniref:Uncharacterized protein n=1 Tax=Mycena belliarum TaxID=1033014 RepID=A0AAD6UET1_9AGAR|nr:hypothetical protein B0H15DRAFT_135799 [Mycena belliae]